jgi:hypothetical protein
MKDWRSAIESLGFRRYAYEKQDNMHCIAFRAVEGDAVVEDALDPSLDSTARLMYIPQDFTQQQQQQDGAADSDEI